MVERRRRVAAIFFICLSIAVGSIYKGVQDQAQHKPISSQSDIKQVAGVATTNADGSLATLATDALKKLAIKGRAPRTGYSRAQFGDGWESIGNCDVRNLVLARDMENVVTVSDTDCTVLKGTLHDPYTDKTIDFKRGPVTSTAVQIDHVVALSDAWQKGAQRLTPNQRQKFANDALNLLAVDGPANQKKSDSDAATWLPPNKSYRCRYVARQIAVKIKYFLWITPAEHDSMEQILEACPDQVLPLVYGT